MNYLKYLARRIRDRIDPDSPVPADLDEVERLQAEALKLKNQIVETHLRLVVSVAKKHVRPALRPARTNQRRHLRPDASRGSVRLRPGQPIQHLCHLGDPQRVHATRPEGKSPPAPSPLATVRWTPSRRPTPPATSTNSEEAQEPTQAAVARLLGSARQAGAADPREPIRDRRRPRADAAADRPGPGDQQGTRPPDREPSPRPSSADSPASRRSSHSRLDTGRIVCLTATDRTTLLQPK